MPAMHEICVWYTRLKIIYIERDMGGGQRRDSLATTGEKHSELEPKEGRDLITSKDVIYDIYVILSEAHVNFSCRW